MTDGLSAYNNNNNDGKYAYGPKMELSSKVLYYKSWTFLFQNKGQYAKYISKSSNYFKKNHAIFLIVKVFVL